MVQTSFTLPVPPGPEGRGRGAAAGEQDGHRAGDGRAQPRHRHRLHVLRRLRQRAAPGRPGRRRTWRSAPTRCCRRRRSTPRSRTGLRRKLVVLGACIGTDAHTVGIDAILNVKGFAGEKGLEYLPRDGRDESRRPGHRARAGAHGARAERADAVLVSQVVTQKDAHLRNTRELAAAFREAMGESPPAAGRRRPPVRPGDGRRARRRQGLRPGDDARRGRQLPRPRPDPAEGARMTRPPARPDRHPPPVRALRARPLRRRPGRRRLHARACSATSPPRSRSVMDGDEGLLAGYSEVRFLGPGAGRRRARGDRRGGAGRPAQPRAALHGAGGGPGRTGARCRRRPGCSTRR